MSIDKKYQIHKVEVARGDYKKTEIIHAGDDYHEVMCTFFMLLRQNLEGANDLRFVELEDTGILFTRIQVYVDGRPFCKKPEEMGPDKYGYV